MDAQKRRLKWLQNEAGGGKILISVVIVEGARAVGDELPVWSEAAHPNS